MVVYRWAGIEDLETLLSLRMGALRAVFSFKKDVDFPSLEKSNRAYYERHLSDGSHAALLVSDGSKIVGTGAVCFEEELPSPDNPSGKCAYFMNVYVLPEERGRGLGTEIMMRLLDRAREEGADKLYLESTPLGRPIYYKLGFVDFPYLLHIPPRN